jgi:hypothetical protein
MIEGAGVALPDIALPGNGHGTGIPASTQAISDASIDTPKMVHF